MNASGHGSATRAKEACDTSGPTEAHAPAKRKHMLEQWKIYLRAEHVIDMYIYIYGSFPFVSLHGTDPCRPHRLLHVFCAGFSLCYVRE